VYAGLATAGGGPLVPLFDRIAEDERVLALGFCGEAGRLEYATKRMPRSINCGSVARTKTDTFV
jgi:trehalose 6-phosphate synthase